MNQPNQGGVYMYNNAMTDPYGQPMQPGYGQPMQPGYGQPMQPGYGQPQPMMQPMMQPMAQPGFPQQQGMMMGQPSMPVNPQQVHGLNGIDPNRLSLPQILMSIPIGVCIKQQIDLMEVLTGCDTANKYFVHEQTDQGVPKKKAILKCKEDSSCCARNCMSADCKPFAMNIFKVPTDEDSSGPGLQVARLVRECKCTCLCCNRPEMKVYYLEGGQEKYLGKVVDSWDCMNYSYKVYNEQEQARFHIEASCCQLGFWCKCPCESCEKIQFDLWSGDKQKPETPIMKKGTGSCIKNAYTLADNFFATWPNPCDWEDRLLIIAALLMIDFMQFEEKQGNQGSG